MKILIVDDEAIARQVLREHLEEIPGVEVVGEAANGDEAVDRMMRLRPDVLLLDLQMPGMDGFAVARRLAGPSAPAIIYVTAYAQHALEAFETGAVDYLLKPVRRERLEAALGKARRLMGAGRPVAYMAKIPGRAGDKTHLLVPEEVVAFRAEGELVHILATSGRYFATSSLRALEEKLDPAVFRRVHRSALINTGHIRTIAPLGGKRWLLTMSNGLEVPVSKRLAGLIRDEARGR
jgi:DNA-binding LytR/AlgR family response regulator